MPSPGASSLRSSALRIRSTPAIIPLRSVRLPVTAGDSSRQRPRPAGGRAPRVEVQAGPSNCSAAARWGDGSRQLGPARARFSGRSPVPLPDRRRRPPTRCHSAHAASKQRTHPRAPVSHSASSCSRRAPATGWQALRRHLHPRPPDHNAPYCSARFSRPLPARPVGTTQGHGVDLNMQSDEARYMHATRPLLSPPFDFAADPAANASSLAAAPASSQQHHHHDLFLGPTLDGPLDDNPDDFYRPYADFDHQRPDIILDGDPYMMATAKRRPAHPNGSASKIASPAAANGRPSPRAPVGASSLSAAKSTPSLAAAARMQNGPVKDRIKQFDQSGVANPVNAAGVRISRSRTPSASTSLSSATTSPIQESRPRRTLQKESPSLRSAAQLTPRQKAVARNGPTRQPLFGEVLGNISIPDAGFGISSITTPHTDLRESMSSRTHSQHASQDFGALDVPSPSEKGAHQRSRSDQSPTGQPLASPSKIPIRTRRNSDLGPSRPESPLDATAAAELDDDDSASGKALSPDRTPRSPTPRRYSPKRLLEPNHTLNAVVKAPPPKLSPPLRSSRPRQPVATATTSASRARTSERNGKPNPSERSKALSPDKKPKPVVPGDVDVAARRARLQSKLHYDQHKPDRLDTKTSIPKKLVKVPRKREESAVLLQPTVFQPKADVQELAVQTHDNEQRQPPNTNRHFAADDDESPILGPPQLYPMGVQAHQPSSLTQARPVPDIEGDDDKQFNLLSHIMSLRRGSPPGTPRTQAVSDFLSEREDGETIRIILGTTPVLPAVTWTNNNAVEGTPDMGSEEEGEYFDARDSIMPDDSVSMIFRNIPDHARSESVPEVPPIPAAFSLDSAARSQINHVLDHYRESDVSPEAAQGFQIQVEQFSPQLPQHAAWTSREATEDYLQGCPGYCRIRNHDTDRR